MHSIPGFLAMAGVLAASGQALSAEPTRHAHSIRTAATLLGCADARFPAVESRSLRTVLADMSRVDHFELFYWTDQDAPVTHPPGSSRELVDLLSMKFNLIVQYRRGTGCPGLRIAKLWVLAIEPSPRPPSNAASVQPPPPPPDPAALEFLRAHGGVPPADPTPSPK